MPISHVKTVTIADGTDTSVVRPSDWNSNHVISLDTSEIIRWVSAGNTSTSNGVLVFANSNNLTFGLSTNALGGTVTGSINAAGGGASFYGGMSNLGNTSGTTGTGSAGLVIVGGNNITLSQSINAGSVTVTISAFNAPAQTIGGYAVGNTTGQSSSSTFDARTVSFDGAGLVSVGYSGGSIIISATQSDAAQTNQTLGAYAVGNTTGQSSSSTFDARTVSFDGAGLVSVGYSGGSIIISATQSDAAQTNQTEGFYAVGNTTGQSSSTTLDARTHSIDGAGIVSVGYSGGSIIISATDAAQTNQTEGFYAVGNTTGQSSSTTLDARTVSFDGAGLVSVGYSGGSIIISATQSDAAQTNQTLGLYGVGNTTGQSSSSTFDARTLSFDGAGIVSVGYSAGSVLISATDAAQTNQTVGLYAVGNTTGQSSSTTVDARTISFDGAGVASVGYSGGSVIISVPSGGGAAGTDTVGISNLGNTAGTSGVATGSAIELILAGGNNITLSQSLNGASATVTISAFNQSNQSVGLYAVGNTTGQSSSTTVDARTISYDGAGIVSVGYSGGSVIISATDAAQTNQTVGLYAVGNTTAQSSSTTVDARTISFDGAGIVSVGYSGGSAVISATTPAQTNQTLGLYAVGNTTGQSSSSTFDARTLSFDGAGIASVGYSGGSVIISVPSGGGIVTLSEFAIGNTTATSSTTFDQRSISYSGAGAITVGYSTTAAGAPALVVSSPASSQLTAGANINLSTNGSTITINGPAQHSQYELPDFGNNTSASSLGQSTQYMMHFFLPDGLSCCRMNRIGSFSMPGTISGSTNQTGGRSNSFGYTETVGLYTRGTGASSTNLYTIFSNSWSFGLSQSVSVASGGATTVTLSHTEAIGFINNIGTGGAITTSSFTSSNSTSSGTTSVSQANQITAVTGSNIFIIPFATSLSAGEYWLAVIPATSITSAGVATTLGSVSNVVMTAITSNWKYLGDTATNTSNRLVEGQGFWNAQVGALTDAMPLSSVNNNSNISLYFNLVNVSV